MIKLTKQQKKQKLEQIPLKPDKTFWDNSDFITLIDMIAQRYHMLPSEVLGLTIFEFSLNAGIALRAAQLENERIKAYKDNMNKKHTIPRGFAYKGR